MNFPTNQSALIQSLNKLLSVDYSFTKDEILLMPQKSKPKAIHSYYGKSLGKSTRKQKIN